MYDLVLMGGRVVDPAQGIDAVQDVAFADGKFVAIGEIPDATTAAESRSVEGLIVTPGLSICILMFTGVLRRWVCHQR